MTPPVVAALEPITDARRAGAVLDPLRAQILALAREPVSATAVAARLALPRQKVNYHVRELARAGLLVKAGTRRKGNLLEQRYVATARAYVLDPALLGPIGPDEVSTADRLSADALLAITARSQREVVQARREASNEDKRLSTWSLSTAVRFRSARARAAFARALDEAIAEVISAHAGAFADADGTAAAGRPYRLVACCHPIPPDGEASELARRPAKEEP